MIFRLDRYFFFNPVKIIIKAALPIFLFGQVSLAASTTVEALIQDMTLDEKLSLIGGAEDGFSTQALPRLNIPSLNMTDGPVGVRSGGGTAFPASIAWAATFNTDLAHHAAAGLGVEALAQNKQILLGPCMDIARVPIAGRLFEGFGEDPYLSAQMSRHYVVGAQSTGIMTTAKHFIAYNQEYERNFTDVRIDDRALHEIYLPPFRAAVNAGVAAVMSSYNKIDQYYASENKRLLTDILKGELKFTGFIMSDWSAIHNSVLAAQAGIDLEMPNSLHFNHPLRKALASGEINETLIDEKVRRLLATFERFGFLNQTVNTTSPNEKNAGRAQGKQIAEESLVLLKNQSEILPLNITNLKSVALIGASGWFARPGGGGSSRVHVDKLPSAITTIESTFKSINSHLVVNKASGPTLMGDHPLSLPLTWQSQFFANTEMNGTPNWTRSENHLLHDWDWSSVSRAHNLPEDNFSAVFTSEFSAPTTGVYTVQLSYDDGVRLYINGALIFENWNNVGFKEKQISYNFATGQIYDLRIEYVDREGLATLYFGISPERDLTSEAALAAKNSEVAVVFLGLSHKVETENFDRPNMFLPTDQVQMLEAVLTANPNTVVVMQVGSPIDMSAWSHRVKAILYAWYPGQDGDSVIAGVLSGKINPSGRLPITLPKRWEDSGVANIYPDDGKGVTHYTDGLFVGYRHFDKNKIKPLYEFGYGLSYTEFSYSNIQVKIIDSSPEHPIVQVKATVENTGRVAGKEVVQLYVTDTNPKRDKAVRELKGFTKITLAPGESKTVELELNFESFAAYDGTKQKWVVDPGEYSIQLGDSSRDIKLSESVSLGQAKGLVRIPKF